MPWPKRGSAFLRLPMRGYSLMTIDHVPAKQTSGFSLVIAGSMPVIVLGSVFSLAIVYSVAIGLVLLLVLATIHATRHFIPLDMRSLYAMLISAFMSGLVHLLCTLLVPVLAQQFGMLLPLVGVQAFVLEAHQAMTVPEGFSKDFSRFVKPFSIFMLLMLSFALFREVFSMGTITIWQDMNSFVRLTIPLLSEHPFGFLGTVSAGFILFGIVLTVLPNSISGEQ